jgi:hypothetical protein
VGSPPGLLGGTDGGVVDLALLGVLGELVLVLGDLLGLGGGASDLERAEVSLPLEALGGDEAEEE